MKDFYNDYIKYASQLCSNNDDYGDKLKVKAHNKAIKKLLSIEKEIIENNLTDVLNNLLQHEDERVKMNACDLCLVMNYNNEKAFKILKELSINSSEALMLLDRHLSINGQPGDVPVMDNSPDN